MAAATLVMGRIKGVQRPAIATVMPTAGPPCVLLDVGANADCKPEHLLQFADMGAAYASVVLGVVGPRVALLNIGEEPTKGSMLAQEAHALMAEKIPNFIGNIEGRDVLAGVDRRDRHRRLHRQRRAQAARRHEQDPARPGARTP